MPAAARRSLAFALAALTALAAVAAEPTLKPETVRKLPERFGRDPRDVAWEDAGHLFVASNRGVLRYSLDGGRLEEVLAAAPVPDGLSEPMAIGTDGRTLEAVSAISSGSYAMRLADRKRLLAQQSHRALAADVAVRGDRVCFLIYMSPPASEEEKSIAVSCGAPGNSWSELKALHSIRSTEGRAIYRASTPPHSGALVMEADGTVDVITSGQPGIYRYSPTGAPMETLGAHLNELVLTEAEDILRNYGSDVDRRYRAVLDTRAMIDDLINTPAGPAIVVRLAEKDLIRWELWFADRSGGAARRVRLGISRYGPFGHLRCDSRGARIACLTSIPPKSEAADPPRSQQWPVLFLFTLPKPPGGRG